jgi:hypothetical protein
MDSHFMMRLDQWQAGGQLESGISTDVTELEVKQKSGVARTVIVSIPVDGAVTSKASMHVPGFGESNSFSDVEISIARHTALVSVMAVSVSV